jgi:hypothetical protein
VAEPTEGCAAEPIPKSVWTRLREAHQERHALGPSDPGGMQRLEELDELIEALRSEIEESRS